MKTYPHATPDGIIELVRKDEHDAAVDEVYNELTEQLASFRAELTRWQSLAERLATALDDCNTKLVGWHGLYPSQVGSDDEATFQAGDKALTTYESAKSGNLPDPLDEAVKRMEEVPVSAMFDNSELPFVDPVIVSTIRARLIAAAKGEQP